MSQARILSLDGIRAAAILAVIAVHVEQRYGYTVPIFDGVGLFFVLSGFLITTLLLREYEKTGTVNMPSFYIRRAFRIMPPLYAYLLLLVLYCAATHIPLALASVVSAALFFQNMTPFHSSRLVEHTWSLAVEEQFYILWPIAMGWAMCKQGRRLAAMLAGGMVVAAPLARMALSLVHSGPLAHKAGALLPARMDALGAGCFVALMLGSEAFERVYSKLAAGWWLAPLTFLVLTPGVAGVYGPRFTLSISYTLDALSMAFFVVWASRNADSFVGRVLNHPIATTIGVMSYSVYLWQTIFIYDGTGVRVLNTMPLGLLLVPIAGFLSYRFVETNSLHLRNYVLSVMSASRRPGRRPEIAQAASAQPEAVLETQSATRKLV